MRPLHNYFELAGMRMHYVDAGPAAARETVVMLHGNPSWSYYYRSLTKGLHDRCRVIVPDHLGMGLSDKPQKALMLQDHIDNLKALLDHLELRDITLVVHDWGGPIGIGYALARLEKVKRIVVMNSAAFFDPALPWRIKICRGPVLGPFAVRRLNLFARAATVMTTVRRLPKEVRQQYLRPYDSYENRAGIYGFLRDIPMEAEHPTRQTFSQIEAGLSVIRDAQIPILILWGAADFCFTQHFLDRWKSYFPQATTVVYEGAGHYLLEDVPTEALTEIKEFMS
ncbi:MAG: alpha/beta fold hydrolase [Coriobacteriia bacterium]|nr:alpha/beta fold hydrolase [Coriobacteriia bacterium]